jgi:hypothetical protein
MEFLGMSNLPFTLLYYDLHSFLHKRKALYMSINLANFEMTLVSVISFGLFCKVTSYVNKCHFFALFRPQRKFNLTYNVS